MRTILALLLSPAVVFAQAALPTEFPGDAVSITPEALKQLLTGRVFLVKPLVDAEIRLQFRDTDVFSNAGSSSNSGRWRIDGSSVCIDWQRGANFCNEVRRVGETLYWKRGNGEIAVLHPR